MSQDRVETVVATFATCIKCGDELPTGAKVVMVSRAPLQGEFVWCPPCRAAAPLAPADGITRVYVAAPEAIS